jgi:hypothetical protein
VNLGLRPLLRMPLAEAAYYALGGKRQEADVGADPGCASVAARGAAL